MTHPVEARATVPMPWRNGRGVTREIAAGPEGAALDDFEWRVSVAEVAADGPFSRFPGVIRTMVLVDGTGVRLTGAGAVIALAHRHAQATVAGADEMQCHCLKGAVRIFNVMVRGTDAAQVQVVRHPSLDMPPARVRVCWADGGDVECRVAARTVVLRDGDALVIDGDDAREPVRVTARGAGAAAFVAAIGGSACA